jgi:signal peptidase II
MTRLLRERRFELLIVVFVVVLDQLTKVLVGRALELHESVDVVPGFLSLTRVHNTGAAFGMLNGVDFAFKAVVMSLVALAGIASVVGGAIGNLIDRATAGYVLDFVDAYWNGWHFWAFNVADAAITIGVGLMILDILGVGRRASNPV